MTVHYRTKGGRWIVASLLSVKSSFELGSVLAWHRVRTAGDQGRSQGCGGSVSILSRPRGLPVRAEVARFSPLPKSRRSRKKKDAPRLRGFVRRGEVNRVPRSGGCCDVLTLLHYRGNGLCGRSFGGGVRGAEDPTSHNCSCQQ